MRRGFAFLLSVLALGVLAPVSFGQYPSPYGPMPMQYPPNPYGPMPMQYAPVQYAPMPYPPPYGYPMPMPARPMYYQPQPQMMPQQAPMWQGQGNGNGNTKVFVYGPLLEEGTVVPPNPVADPPRSLPVRKPDTLPAPIKQAQAPYSTVPTLQTDSGGYHTLPTFSKADLMPDACGSSCDDGLACAPACRPSCGPQVYEPPMRGRGHFIGEVAASFLVPVFNTRTAYSTTAGGVTTTTDFNHVVDVAPSGYVGYVMHNGWGIRGGFFHFNGSTSTSVNNADPTVAIATPTGGAFGITSPSPAVANGIGVDQFKFTQRISADVADLEVVKEASFFDTAFLFSFGGRYARFQQSYTATRNNPGGTNGIVTTALDHQETNVSNELQGWGPTVSMDVVHPLCRWGLSAYGTARGSFLWGTDRFSQSDSLVNTTIPAGGAPVFTNTSNSANTYETRYVSAVDTEAGLQYGCRVGHCYVFMRAGATFQRWWDIGNPSTPHGSLNLIGGTARVGITY
jgi:Legionella pneumophila major outer membrane protein precursor